MKFVALLSQEPHSPNPQFFLHILQGKPHKATLSRQLSQLTMNPLMFLPPPHHALSSAQSPHSTQACRLPAAAPSPLHTLWFQL